MHRIAAEARIITKVGFHLPFNLRIVQSLDARSKRLLQLLPVKVVGNFVSPRGRLAVAICFARMIANASNHSPHDAGKCRADGSADGATLPAESAAPDVAA
jgi:hypothetical protein